ncbi:MAG: hypothetical protein NVS3B10_01540 [Polyangiales bacterium]
MDSPAHVLSAVMERILVPGVTGGSLGIGRPFGKRRARLAAMAAAAPQALLAPEPPADAGAGETDAALAEVRALLPTGSLDEAEDAVVRRMRRLVAADVSALGPRLEGGVVELAALFHDAVAAYHPDLAGVFRARAPHRLLEATVHALECVHPPATVRGALLRHAWLGELVRHELVRTEVQWWTGRSTFLGRTPPRRLLAWPELRRVKRRERTAELLRLPDLFGERDPELAALYARAMSAFLVATPITDLVLAARMSPPFVWTVAHASLVASPAAARIAHRAIARGDHAGKPAFESIAAAAGAVPASLRAHPA